MDNSDTGSVIIGENIKTLSRFYFGESSGLIGMKVTYWAPLENKSYDGYGELNSFFYPPIEFYCFYNGHPDQKTLQKEGWVSELGETSLLIVVPYDTYKIQQGALFKLPASIDGAPGRKYKVISMSSISAYPDSMTCEIAPIYETTYDASAKVDQGAISLPLNDIKDEYDDDFSTLRGRKKI